MILRPAPTLLLLLAACTKAPVAPEQLFQTTVLPRIVAGDETGFLDGLKDLCKKSPSFKANFESALLVYLPEPRLKNEPHLHILTPSGVAAYPEWNPRNGAIRVRWFDERKPARDPKRLSLRMFAAKVFARDPDHPREKGEFLAENMIVDNIAQPDGSGLTEFTTRYLPAGWVCMEIRDPDSPVTPDKVEDQVWFTYSYAAGPLRATVASAREALKVLCERGQVPNPQRDLLLARMLASFEYLRPAAQLLELLHKDGHRSAGSDALLKSVYAALGRGPAVPPEPPRRDDTADFDKPMH
jgi:hypothetical protein